MDDHIFEEGDVQDRLFDSNEFINGQFVDKVDDMKNKNGLGLFFIIQGDVIILQKTTKTYIKDLTVQHIFGEIGFFSGSPRTVTARSRNFSEIMYLNQMDFLKTLIQKHTQAFQNYEEVRLKLIKNPNEYTPLFLNCYRCHSKGHIAIQCDFFYEIEGNLEKRDLQQNIKKKKKEESENLI